jgi:hypothetical protein
MSERRVVLVKPGDVLIFGNVGHAGELEDGDLETLNENLSGLRDALKLAYVMVFAEDIDLAVVSDAVAGS